MAMHQRVMEHVRQRLLQTDRIAEDVSLRGVAFEGDSHIALVRERNRPPQHFLRECIQFNELQRDCFRAVNHHRVIKELSGQAPDVGTRVA